MLGMARISRHHLALAEAGVLQRPCGPTGAICKDYLDSRLMTITH